MNWTLEAVAIPVSDADRAKALYAEKIGFTVDYDTRGDDGSGFVQLTPRGSSCSVMLGKGVVDSKPGSTSGLWLVVPDVLAARAELAGRGVEVSEPHVFDGAGFRPATGDDDLDLVGFVFFSDTDGNGWAVQQIASRG